MNKFSMSHGLVQQTAEGHQLPELSGDGDRCCTRFGCLVEELDFANGCDDLQRYHKNRGGTLIVPKGGGVKALHA